MQPRPHGFDLLSHFKRHITVGDVCLFFLLDVVVSLLVVFSVKSLCHIFVCCCIWLRRRHDPSLQPDAGREECDALSCHDYQHRAFFVASGENNVEP